jgi:hypothetical protein
MSSFKPRSILLVLGILMSVGVIVGCRSSGNPLQAVSDAVDAELFNEVADKLGPVPNQVLLTPDGGRLAVWCIERSGAEAPPSQVWVGMFTPKHGQGIWLVPLKSAHLEALGFSFDQLKSRHNALPSGGAG